MSNFNPPPPIAFPDPQSYPDVKFFAQALAALDADDRELAAENATLDQQLADLQAQVVITQALLKRNQDYQANQDATRAFIVSRQPVSTPPTDAAPVIVSVAPLEVDGTKVAGDPITVVIAFDKPVNVTGTPQVTLSDGALVDYGNGTGTTAIDFPHIVTAGETTNGNVLAVVSVNLNGGSVSDATATPANLTLPATATLGSITVAA